MEGTSAAAASPRRASSPLRGDFLLYKDLPLVYTEWTLDWRTAVPELQDFANLNALAPLRLLLAADEEGLYMVHFCTSYPRNQSGIPPAWRFVPCNESNPEALSQKSPILHRAITQLQEYFGGERLQFDLPFKHPFATDFQKSVWQHLQTIPFGTTTSYSAIARTIGKPKAVRAVGTSNGANPLGICVPCHRVIGADGSLRGFSGGLDNKRALLHFEQKVKQRKMEEKQHKKRGREAEEKKKAYSVDDSKLAKLTNK
ncbi:Methylated-DNA--protein-cysteine methyltransferase [Balamuthia mandrillaris]